MTTAFLTGVIILWMLLFPMANVLLGWTIVIDAWFTLILLPFRKSLAIAIDYFIEQKYADSP